jgi:YidC/Oxa1 family membrane protein insertase
VDVILYHKEEKYMDSANKTFFIMVLLTMVCFGITLYQFFNPKENITTIATNESQVNETEKIKLSNDEEKKVTLISEVTNLNETIKYENDKLKVLFDSKKGEISNLFIKTSDQKAFDIVDSDQINNALKLKLGSWKDGIELNTLFSEDSIYTFNNDKNRYTFSCDFKVNENEEEIIYRVEKIYTFYENENIFHFKLKLSNNKNKEMRFDSSETVFSLGWGPSLGVSSTNSAKKDERYEQFRFLSNDKIININSKNKIFRGTDGFATVKKAVKDDWLVSDSHYFTSVIIPDTNDYDYFFDYSKSEDNLFYCGLSLKSDKSVIETSFNVYCGPKSGKILKRYDNFKNDDVYLSKKGLSKLDPPIVWGLGDLLGWFLKVLYMGVKNYGLAIIILTIILKALLSPLMANSMKNSQKMQTLQPKLAELQAKYKDKPEMLSQKTMELYKKSGINPMSGCLPMLLQMPFLFAMYQLLDRMFELKGASFLWIKDLAMPDSLITFGFTIPLLNIESLNILPIIMVVTQVFQSLLTPGMGNNQQAKMMIWLMPLMFFFFFYNVSSGLVLYWTIMNLLGIIQQVYMNKKLLVTNEVKDVTKKKKHK